MKINIISTDNRHIASDYTITGLIDNHEIFLNTIQDVNIINKSRMSDFAKCNKNDSRIYGLRLVDDVPHWFKRFSDNEAMTFFVVSSYESYLLLTNELGCEKPVLYLEDMIMTPAIEDNVVKSDRAYTFCNPVNLDDRLLNMENMDIYTADSYFIQDEEIYCNFRGRAKGRVIEWTPDIVAEYARYKTAHIYYSKKYPEGINKLKSINRMSQCFYFNQEVVTNYPGRFHPDIEKELTMESIDGEFYKIGGNTRRIYDTFLSRAVIKNSLINFCNKLV